MKMIQDMRNELLRRREVKLIVEAERNPGSDFGRKEVASKFKSDENLVVVKKIGSKFGRNTFLIDAFIYDSADMKEKIEQKPKVKKTAGAPAEEKK